MIETLQIHHTNKILCKLNVNIKLYGLLDKRIITNELLYFSWKNIDVPRFSHVYVDSNESKLMIMMYGRGNASFTSICILYLTRLIMFSKVMPCTNQILLHFILQSRWCVYTYSNSKRETWMYFVWISLTDLSALNIDAFNGSMNLPHNINKQASITILGNVLYP